MMHHYLSTACFHGHCGNCRQTCKFCDQPCGCSCHLRPALTQEPPASWTDQARDMAAELHRAAEPYLPAELRKRIAEDPALFWLRGEVQPDGTWQ